MRKRHRSEEHENLWRSVVPWLLRHGAGMLPADDVAFLEEIISHVAISDPQRGRLSDIMDRVIKATDMRPWD